MTSAVRRALALVATTALFGAMTGCAAVAEPEETSISIRTWAIPGNWSPFEGMNMDGLPFDLVYEPLIMEVGYETEYVPWLASDYELSGDGRTVTVTLRNDVEFADGVHMDADGVVEYLDALFASDGYFQGPVTVGEYQTEVVATGDYELEITTATQIRESWFTAIARTPIASPASLDDREALATTPAGSGPYSIGEVIPDVSITYTRNAGYWNLDAYPFDEVRLVVFDDDVAALNAVKTGQLDAGSIGAIPLAVEAKNSGLTLSTGAGSVPGIVVMDRGGLLNPAFADARVRQAMNLAFDRPAIDESLNSGLGRVSSQLFVPGQRQYVEDGDDYYGYDLAEARRLMAEAGYADGFEVTIPVLPSTMADYQPIIEQSLGEIGIRVTFEVVGTDDEVGKLITEYWPSGKWPLAIFPLPVTTTASFYWLEHFWGGFQDPHVDDLVATIRQGSVAERDEATSEFGRYVLEEAWFIPISTPPAMIVSRPGIRVDILGTQNDPQLWQYTIAE